MKSMDTWRSVSRRALEKRSGWYRATSARLSTCTTKSGTAAVGEWKEAGRSLREEKCARTDGSRFNVLLTVARGDRGGTTTSPFRGIMVNQAPTTCAKRQAVRELASEFAPSKSVGQSSIVLRICPQRSATGARNPYGRLPDATPVS